MAARMALTAAVMPVSRSPHSRRARGASTCSRSRRNPSSADATLNTVAIRYSLGVLPVTIRSRLRSPLPSRGSSTGTAGMEPRRSPDQLTAGRALTAVQPRPGTETGCPPDRRTAFFIEWEAGESSIALWALAWNHRRDLPPAAREGGATRPTRLLTLEPVDVPIASRSDRLAGRPDESAADCIVAGR